ncbi:MAG: 50S ribosomal protein L17 [Proteobacteria bacterium]|jgi:large subunit ribosomal protein L17|nr:50S ribosomal protein L17 [Pseudomonadota bacterium]
MRHQKKTVKLGRSQAHRDSLLSNQVCSLIEHRRIKTTLAKAKATKPLAERMVTLGKKGNLHARRIALSYLKHKDIVKKLFTEIAPAAADRKGGYTRIVKLGARLSDSAPMAYLEWVDYAPEVTKEEPATEAAAKPAKAEKPAPKKKAAPKKAKEEKGE